MLTREKLIELANNYGTPLFVYDGDQVINCYRDLFRFIPHPRLKIHYALKANFNPGILRLLQNIGCGIDAVSPAEVNYALRLGFSPEKIILTANNMTDSECERMVASGVLMNIGSISRLRKLAQNHPGTKLCLRFNPDVCDGDSAMTMTAGDLTKFGILMEDADLVAKIVKQGNLHIVGLHSHTGSGLQHMESVLQSMRNLMSVATRERFPELEFLDFGGGFKVPYKPDEVRIDYVRMGKEISDIFNDFCSGYGRDLEICFEPGKYLVAEAGYLIMEVNTIKYNRTRTIAGCNSGFPQLIRPVLYNAYHRIDNLSNPDGTPKIYDICGNICETGDRFAEQREIAEIREYDLLAIANAGAYCYSMGSIYNLRPLPTEVVISNDKVFSLRERESENAMLDRIIRETEQKND